MNSLKKKSLNLTRKIKVNFDGGDLTSNSRLLLYKGFDGKIGLSVDIENNLQVKNNTKFRYYTKSDIVIQKIYHNIASYHIDDNELINDLAFTTILHKEMLASQLATISRFNIR